MITTVYGIKSWYAESVSSSKRGVETEGSECFVGVHFAFLTESSHLLGSPRKPLSVTIVVKLVDVGRLT